jgi:hypothetical protein
VLKVNMKITPPDPDRNRANTVDMRRKMADRTLPREKAAKVKINSVLKYSWASKYFRPGLEVGGRSQLRNLR